MMGLILTMAIAFSGPAFHGDLFVSSNSPRFNSLGLTAYGSYSDSGVPDRRLFHTAVQGVVGLSLYSWLVPSSLELEGKTATVVGLWTPVFWTAGQYMFAKANAPISAEEVTMSGAGAYDGFFHGLLLGPDDAPPRLPLGLSLLENVGGFYLARSTRPTEAMVIRRVLQSINGYTQGAALAELTNAGKDATQNIMAFHSIASGYGSYLASVAFQDTLTTQGDAIFEYVSATTLGVSSFMFFLPENDEKLSSTAYLIGNYAGYGLGLLMSQKRDISVGGAFVTAVVPPLVNGLLAGTLILVDAQPETVARVEGILLPLSVYGVYYLLSE